MKIAGIEKCSLVDYPGKMAAAFFAPGCNMNCFYCHNRQLLERDARDNCIDLDSIRDFLTQRQGFLEGVVITGGEPTLHPELKDFAAEVKEMGYCVKLDTNGARPDTVRALIEAGSIDYVAMDIKAPLQRYQEIVGVPIYVDAIQQSIDLLLEGHVEYEFRTTVVPQFDEDDIVAMARQIGGAKLYVLQQYRKPEPHNSTSNDPNLDLPPHPGAWIEKMAERIAPFVQTVETRGL